MNKNLEYFVLCLSAVTSLICITFFAVSFYGNYVTLAVSEVKVGEVKYGDHVKLGVMSIVALILAASVSGAIGKFMNMIYFLTKKVTKRD